MIEFTVYGIPKPQGSKTAMPFRRKNGKLGANLLEGSTPKSRAAFKSWRKEIAEHAYVACLYQTGSTLWCGSFSGPIQVSLSFFLPRPKSLPKRVIHSSKKPDLDKLVRTVFDGMTGILFKDDSQIVSLTASKEYAANGTLSRVEVILDILKKAD
jgi:Holliday junction resolvase RusA-like endonuclease